MVHLNHLPGHLGKDVGLTYISGYLRVWWNSWYVWDPRPCPGTMIFLDFYFFYVCSLTLLHRNQFPFYAILCKNVQKWTKVKNSSVFTNYGPNKSKNDQKRKIKKAQLPKSAYSLILDHCESGPVRTCQFMAHVIHKYLLQTVSLSVWSASTLSLRPQNRSTDAAGVVLTPVDAVATPKGI